MTTESMTMGVENPATSETRSTEATRKASLAAHKAVDSLVEPAAKAERKVRDLATRAEQSARDGKEQVVARTESLLDDARDYAKEKPLAAAGISFAAGLLLSLFLRK